MFDDDGFSALEAGAAYALYRGGQDAQTRQLSAALQQRNDDPIPQEVHVHVHTDEEELGAPPIEVSELDLPQSWGDLIGQGPLKKRMGVEIAAAKEEGVRLPHTLFASGFPGVGKTSAAYLVAREMGVRMVKMIPPFNAHVLVDTALNLSDHDILFLDEVHILANNGKRGAEFLLPILEDGVAYLDGEEIVLPDITFIGATTDRDKLPRTVIDRFKIKPYFQAYDEEELSRIAVEFAWKHDALSIIDDPLCVTMALACQGVPRIIDEMVSAAKALTLAPMELSGSLKGTPPTPEQLLEFLEVEPDGTTREHIEYITALLQYYPREKPKGEGVEFIAGESTMMQRLRQTKQGIGQIEGFLIDRGLIDRTPRGRRLTSKGIGAAMSYIVQGKGAAAHG